MNWKICLADIDIGKEEIESVTGVLNSKWLTAGEVTKEFEEKFAKYLGVKYAFAVSSGTAALHLAYCSVGIKRGDEVIVPSFTFAATVNTILHTGAKPAFAEITSLNNLNISPEDIERKITPHTKAITVVHYAGYPCEMDKITAIAKKHNLFIIEDAAHAPGAEDNRKKCGAIGDIGCFSFYSIKNLTTGEGGMVVTNRADFADRIRLLRSHGMTSSAWDRHRGYSQSYDVVDVGYNYRLDEIRSAIGIVQLKKLNKNREKRKVIVDLYKEKLKDTDGLKVPFGNFKGKPAYHIFPIILKDKTGRKEFIEKMKKNGVQTSIHYLPVHLFSYYRKTFGYKRGDLPLTEEVGDKEVTLPLYPNMREKDLQFVIETAKK